MIIVYLNKKNIMCRIILIFCFVTTLSWSQNSQMPVIDDFVVQHNGFEENDAGEITPLNEKEINKIVRFKIEADFPDVELIRNIIWDSYTTFVSPFKKYHYHTFIVQVKMPDVERYRYVDVKFDPFEKKAEINYAWDKDLGDFKLKEVTSSNEENQQEN